MLYGAGQWAVARYSATTGALQFVNVAAGSGPGGTGVLSAEPRGVWFSFPTGTINTSSLLRSSDLAAILTAAPTVSVGRLNTHVGEVLWSTQAGPFQLACLDPASGNVVAGTDLIPTVFAHDASGGETPTRSWARFAPGPTCPRMR